MVNALSSLMFLFVAETFAKIIIKIFHNTGSPFLAFCTLVGFPEGAKIDLE